MSYKLAGFKRRRALSFGIGVLGLALLLPTFINKIIRSEHVRAETPGGTCIAATQDSHDKLIANYGDVYSDASDPNKTQVVITDPATAPDDDVVCIPDVNLKDMIISGATAATNITVADIKALPTYLSSSSSQEGLTSLIGLEYAQQLTALRVSGHPYLSDVSPLAGLTNLTDLDLGSNQISNISVLSGLTNLTKLSVSWNQISNISVLSGLTNLTNLSLYHNQVSDITPLAGLTNLTSLILSWNQISNISVLFGLTNLTYLSLEHNQIPDATPLAGLINLTYLDLGSNQIPDATPLAGLTNLTDLDLRANQISDVTPLAGLTNLTDLDLGVNQISDVTPLAGLTNLTDLDLGVNQISDIAPLAGLTNLTDLDLCRNQISNITLLSGLTNLTDLDLHRNQISDISALSGLTNLTDLALSQNQISDISAIATVYQAIQNSGSGGYFLAAGQKALVDVATQSATVSNPLRQFSGALIQPSSVDAVYATYDSGVNQFSLFDLPEFVSTEFATFQLNCAQRSGDDPATTVCFSGTLSARHNPNMVTPGDAPKSGISLINCSVVVISIASLGLGAIALAITKQRKIHFKK